MSNPYARPTVSDQMQYMVCPKCKLPAMMEFWEWHDMPEDKLQCPNCGKQVKIGDWYEGVPPEPEHQQCLMCGGEGVIK